MKIKILVFSFLLMISLAIADTEENGNDVWNWYFVSFMSPGSSNILIRSGTADVSFGGANLQVNFLEKGVPEFKAFFKGKVNKGDKIKGELIEFFMHGPEDWSGYFRQKKDTKDCFWQEIVLQPRIPDGAVLMLSKIKGKCQ